MKIIYIAFFFLMFSVSVLAQKSVLSEPYVLRPPSLISVLANPEQYHEKRVRVFGFLHYGFEDSGLYFSKDDGDYLNNANAIWITYNKDVKLDASECKGKSQTITNLDYFNGRYVLLDGTFNMNGHGHFGVYSGELTDVVTVIEMRRWYDGRKKVVKFKDERIVPEKCEQ